MLETTSQGTILVVDDEIKNSKLVEALLAPRGYTVIKAFNGQEAIERAKECRPDLILLDVTMPVMNGFEACRMLKEDSITRLIPVVFMTALGQVEDRIKGLDAGGDDFLTKPVDREELMARVRSSIRHKKAMDQRINLLQKAQDHLAKFVPESLQRLIAQNPISPDLEKKKQDVSVLFVDISGYAKLTESLTQEHVNFIVESLFSGFVDSIKANGGEISSTAGDGMMVLFLDPDPVQNACDAMQTALELLQLTKQLDEQPAALKVFEGNHEPIKVHIGVNSGEAFVGPAKFEGNIGTHWTYTAVGSSVNVAARISALAKGQTVLLSEETARRIRGRFSLNEIGLRELNNVSNPIMIFELTGPTTSG